MKTKRLRQKIKDYLEHGPKNTTEILEYINKTSRHGSVSQQIGNVLSKDKDIVKVGYVKKLGTRYGSFSICLWGLKSQFPEGEPEGPKVDIEYVNGRPELVSID